MVCNHDRSSVCIYTWLCSRQKPIPCKVLFGNSRVHNPPLASLPPAQIPAQKRQMAYFQIQMVHTRKKNRKKERYIPTHDVLTIFLDVGRNSLPLRIFVFVFASCFKLQVFDLFYFCHV